MSLEDHYFNGEFYKKGQIIHSENCLNDYFDCVKEIEAKEKIKRGKYGNKA